MTRVMEEQVCLCLCVLCNLADALVWIKMQVIS